MIVHVPSGIPEATEVTLEEMFSITIFDNAIVAKICMYLVLAVAIINSYS